MKVLFIVLAFSVAIWPERTSSREEYEYYRDEFTAGYKYPVYDTLFEKIVWERKVSHIVMEFHGSRAASRDSDEYRVTLLMMEEYPYNYKGQNYPIHFAFKSFPEAAKKFEEINHFLRNSGVMAVGIEGKKIVKERVLVAPVGNVPARPNLNDWPGNKDTEPILTREALPKRLPLKISPR